MENVPSVNPSNTEDLTGAFKHIFNKMLQRVDGMIPARIIAFDRATNRASVQPLIKMLTTGGFVVSRAPLASVPVMQFGGGGFVMNYPFNQGDLGWIKANDRDISLFLQSYNEAQPNTIRIHNFSDGVFIPDVMKGWTIASEDSINAVIQNLSGTVKISLGANKVTITAPTIVNNCGVFEVNATSSFTVNSPASAFNGGTVTNDGTSIDNTHIHPQAPDSAGNTQQDTGVPL